MKKYLSRKHGVVKDSGAAKPSLAACLELVFEHTPDLLDDVLQTMQERVEQMAKAQQEQALKLELFAPVAPVPLDLLRRFLEHRPAFAQRFTAHLQQVVKHGGEKQTSPTAVRFDDFTLLEEEQIDANIEVALVEQTLLQAVQERLPLLNALVSSLMGWTTVQGQFNPLRPENYAQALRLTLHELMPREDASHSGLQVMLATVLGAALANLYVELNDWLKSAGVEPLQMGSVLGKVDGAPTKVQKTMLTMDKLRRLLSQEVNLWPTHQDFVHTVPSSLEALEDLKLVDTLMQRLTDRAHQAGVAPAPATLEDADEKNNRVLGRQLGKQLGQEVVHLMLDHLAQDGRIPLQVRLSLAELEDVLNALAEQDPRFFSDRKHPARLFLERITHRSLGFRNSSDLGYVAFQSMVESTVAALRKGTPDAAAFAQQLQLLEQRWTQEDAAVRAQAQAQAKELVLQEQRDLLADKWAKEHMRQVAHRPVPEFVQDFLRGPWAQVVAEAEMRGSDAAAELEGYSELVRKLIWSTQLAKVQKHPGRLMRMVPRMLMTLRQGLQTIDYPDASSKAFLDSMIAVHEQAFDTARAQFEPLPTLTAVVAKPQAADDVIDLPENLLAPDGVAYVPPADVSVPDKPDPALTAAWSSAQLQPGAWVDLAWNGQWLRAQLNWVSPQRTLFMFVSSGGFSHSMSRRTMRRLRGLGLLRWVSDGHVMDNALDAVAKVALQNDIDARRDKR